MDGKTEEEIQAEVERVMQELISLEREAQARGEVFVRLDEETLRRKIAGEGQVNTPFFDGWSASSGTAGGTASVTVYAYNPDPATYYYHGYLAFGPSCLIRDTDLSLTSVDTRLPRYTRSLFLYPNSSSNRTYPIPIPPDFPPGLGGYIGSCYMVNLYTAGFQVAQVIDRTTLWIVVN
jgi:hypothetical protein